MNSLGNRLYRGLLSRSHVDIIPSARTFCILYILCILYFCWRGCGFFVVLIKEVGSRLSASGGSDLMLLTSWQGIVLLGVINFT